MLFTFTSTLHKEVCHGHRSTARRVPKPVWIALMILGFIAWWPIGLVVLALLIGSGRMGCWSHHGGGRWQNKMERMQAKMDRMRAEEDFGGGCDWCGHPAVERQPRFRRVSLRNAQAARRRATRIPRFPRPVAVRQGQDRVRSVHGRPPQPPPGRRLRAATAKLSHKPAIFRPLPGRERPISFWSRFHDIGRQPPLTSH